MTSKKKIRKILALVALIVFIIWIYNTIIINLINNESTSSSTELAAIAIAVVIGLLIICLIAPTGSHRSKKKEVKEATPVNLEEEKARKERMEIEKLKEILSVSDRITLERVQNALNLDDNTFNKKIIEWAKEFGFRIDGEYLITQGESVEAFVSALEKQFIEWEKMEKDNIGKV